MEKNKKLFKILEINENASQDDIKKAYKKLAIKYHPDKNIHNKMDAIEKFQEILHAYQILFEKNLNTI